MDRRMGVETKGGDTVKFKAKKVETVATTATIGDFLDPWKETKVQCL
ncbi:MAG: hypothetical protein HXS54_04145 [Theionarchaea archaeon]|nr:hypothetical protein [Theionarchaea archaeon]